MNRFFAQFSGNGPKTGKVYMITSNNTDKIYIGSTTQTDIFVRLIQHWLAYQKFKKGKIKKYCSSFEIIEKGEFTIKLIEEMDDISKLLQQEKFHINANEKCSNKNYNKKLKVLNHVVT